MTVSTTDNKALHTGNGVLVDFAYTYRMDNDEDMEVYLDDVLQPSGYVVNRNPDNIGGSVTFDVAPAVDVIITLLRVLDLDQNTDYTPYDEFPAEAHEDALDKLTMISQQQQEQIDRNSQGIGGEPGVDTSAPPFEANKAWKWSDGATEKKIINSTYDPDEQVSLAQQSAQQADASASSAAGSASSASASQNNAYLWSSEAEDVPVDDGVNSGFSAFHWAEKAKDNAATGEANTASNLGLGQGVYAQKVGVDLQFKGFGVDGGLSIGATADTITIGLPDGAVTNTKLGNDSVTSSKIVAGTIQESDLADNSVSEAKLQNLSVTVNKIAADSVRAENIIDGEVGTNELAASAVTTNKILDAAVTSPKLDVASLQSAGLVPTAWVIFDGSTGGLSSPCPILDSFGVASVDQGSTAGNYTITFTTPMNTVNYVVNAMCQRQTGAANQDLVSMINKNTDPAVDSFQVVTQTFAQASTSSKRTHILVFGGK